MVKKWPDAIILRKEDWKFLHDRRSREWRNLKFWSNVFTLSFWRCQCLRLLRPCRNQRGQKTFLRPRCKIAVKNKNNIFHELSWNSEVETSWISLIGWPYKMSNTYVISVSWRLSCTIKIQLWKNNIKNNLHRPFRGLLGGKILHDMNAHLLNGTIDHKFF